MTYSALSELGASLFMYSVLDVLGRRRSLAGCLGALGGSCIAMAFLPKSQEVLVTVLYVFGRFASTCRWGEGLENTPCQWSETFAF